MKKIIDEFLKSHQKTSIDKSLIDKLSVDELRDLLIKLIADRETPRLPKIIFGECHVDFITDRILTEMTEPLARLGYSEFFEELPGKEHLSLYAEDLSESDNGMTMLEECPKLETYISNKIIPTREFIALRKEISALKDSYPELKEAYDIFLHTLLQHNIGYRKIDDPSVYPKEVSAGSVITAEKEMEIRDNYMANKYLHSTKLVYGRVGLDHFSGIQKWIKNSNNLSNKSFLFFNAYTYSGTPDLYRKIDKEEFPYGVIELNGNELTKADMIKKVLKAILDHLLLAYEKNINPSNSNNDMCQERKLESTAAVLNKFVTTDKMVKDIKLTHNEILSENTLVNRNLQAAYESKLISEEEVRNLRYESVTVRYIFNNDFGLIGLKAKLFKLEDLDGIFPAVLKGLMSAAGLSLLSVLKKSKGSIEKLDKISYQNFELSKQISHRSIGANASTYLSELSICLSKSHPLGSPNHPTALDVSKTNPRMILREGNAGFYR